MKILNLKHHGVSDGHAIVFNSFIVLPSNRYKWEKEEVHTSSSLIDEFSHIHSSATTLQTNAHWRQASAHVLQLSPCIACSSHTWAHALQTNSHKALISALKVEFLACIRAVKAQISAQSRHISAQTSRFVSIQSVRQRSHAVIQAKQLSMDVLWILMSVE